MSKNNLTAKKRRRLRWYIKTSRIIFSSYMSFWMIILGGGIISLGVLVILWKAYPGFSGVNATNLGQFGDFIGGIVGSIWALAGVILFYMALTLQRKEFNLQRQELRETRRVFEAQSDHLRQQQRENTFFNLLNHHTRLVNQYGSDRISSNVGALDGSAALEEVWRKIAYSLQTLNRQIRLNEPISTHEVRAKNHILETLKDQSILLQVHDSILIILEFIRTELDSAPFFYRSLRSNLSRTELEIFTCCANFLYHDKFENLLDEVPEPFFIYRSSEYEWFTEYRNIPPIVNISFFPDTVSKENTKDVQMNINSNQNIVLKSVLLHSELLEKEIVIEEEKDSIFVIKSKQINTALNSRDRKGQGQINHELILTFLFGKNELKIRSRLHPRNATNGLVFTFS